MVIKKLYSFEDTSFSENCYDKEEELITLIIKDRER